MSIAGERSSRGDEYQLRIALNWLIRMLDDGSIRAIQAESTGVPDEDYPVSVDDVVVLFQDGSANFIQAKKNQPQYRHWSFTDVVLQEELCKARDQLESRELSTVYFYSRSPFGDLQALTEGCQAYPDYPSFTRDAPKTLTGSLSKLTEIIKRSEEASFYLVRRLQFGPPLGFEDWDHENLAALDRIVSRAEQAMPILERFLGSHQAKLRDVRYLITRKDIFDELAKHGIMATPKRSEAEILNIFVSASRIGRNWLRTVGGEKIPRSELQQLIALVDQGSRSILLTDRPGSGKTCLLLDFADYIENSTSWGMLFIKGDQFTDAEDEAALARRGLPEDITGQCARLATYRRVVVIIDSLDVLSLSRRHGALKVFLGLMDRLAVIDGLTLIVACRDFDLKYDPLLRGRKWQQKVIIGPLDFDSVVSPLLRKWGIEPTGLNSELKKLITLPQNLRLFEKLAQRQPRSLPLTVFELYERFFDEVIAQDQVLGQSVVTVLQELADRLIQQRTQSFSRAALLLDEGVAQRLISQEVLVETNAGTLAFSHQTVADSLLVRSAIVHGKSLEDFILAYPPFPFIRPSVRSFFFFLRSSQPDVFRRQVRAVLSNDEIAYHLERLIVESIAEILPVNEDWPLLRWIFHDHPDLFKRVLWHMESDHWFHFLIQHWLSDAKIAPDRTNWLLQFVSRLKTWMNRFPVQVISLWREALSAQWAELNSLVWEITLALDKFERWETQGIRELLNNLNNVSNDQHGSLGKPLSQWIQATDSGDDLLWFYISKNVTAEDMSQWNLGNKLRCEPHEFCTADFLANRLCKSGQLLTLALDDLDRWNEHEPLQLQGQGLRTGFLHETTWRFRHTAHDIHHSDSLTILADAIEKALKFRANNNDEWWRINEPRFRNSYNAGIRYLFVEAYKVNLEINLAGIEAQLTDGRLFRFGNIEYELGQFMRAAYPLISTETQIQNQAIVLELYRNEDFGPEVPPEWISREIYNYLIWIPAIFRTREGQNFIDTWQNRFGSALPDPQIHSSGGTVEAPLTAQELLAISDEAILRLLYHYNDYRGWHEIADGRLVGGRDQVKYVLRTGSSLDPKRFLYVFNRLFEEGYFVGYLCAIIDGIGDHLRYRFGNLQKPNGWTSVEPIPPGRDLALLLLSLLERYPIIWERDWTVSHAIEACSYALSDTESAERLTFLLSRLVNADEPSTERAASSDDVVFMSVNSTRGVAAESMMITCNKLLEADAQLPELLPILVRRFARDPMVSVRVSILIRLPYLMHKMPAFGWQVFADIFNEPQTKLWLYAEKCLYYQYREHFDQIEPYLKRILQEGGEDAGEVWGRIAALACLSGQLTEDMLFTFLQTASVTSHQGIAQVFSANLDRQDHNLLCREGLFRMLRQNDVPQKVITTVEHACFGRESNYGQISRDFALTFLDTAMPAVGSRDLHHFLDWLGNEARRAPLIALEVAESLVSKLEGQDGQQRLWHTEPLVAALIEILREADESDDQDLIRRALDLQDRFLRLDIYGMDDLFNQSIH